MSEPDLQVKGFGMALISICPFQNIGTILGRCVTLTCELSQAIVNEKHLHLNHEKRRC
jgi:hypothetical protein